MEKEKEKETKNTVLIHVTIPDRIEFDKEQAWHKVKSKINSILQNHIDNAQLSDNVYLLHLPKDLAILSNIVSFLELPKFSYEVLYFDGEPQWIFES